MISAVHTNSLLASLNSRGDLRDEGEGTTDPNRNNVSGLDFITPSASAITGETTPVSASERTFTNVRPLNLPDVFEILIAVL